MSSKPVITNYFAGGNTAYGFYSLFEHIPVKNGKKFIIFKGGPGTGKSTILKQICTAMCERGLDVECFYCSSDSRSLDGISIPSLGAAVVDGTAPHTIDPVLPGVYDQIINLGEHWNEQVLQSHRDKITAVSAEIKYCFASTYRYLAEAKLALDHLKQYTAAVVDFDYASAAAHELLERHLDGEAYRGQGRERHLFAGAITPEGFVNFYPNILSRCSGFYLLAGDPGTGKSTLLEKLYRGFSLKGFALEIYRCALDPHKIDCLVVPEKRLAFVKATDPHRFIFGAAQEIAFVETLSLNHFSPADSAEKSARREECRRNITALLEKALTCLKEVKVHSALREQYYRKAMDFAQLNTVKDRILEQILALHEQE